MWIDTKRASRPSATRYVHTELLGSIVVRSKQLLSLHCLLSSTFLMWSSLRANVYSVRVGQWRAMKHMANCCEAYKVVATN